MDDAEEMLSCFDIDGAKASAVREPTDSISKAARYKIIFVVGCAENNDSIALFLWMEVGVQ